MQETKHVRTLTLAVLILGNSVSARIHPPKDVRLHWSDHVLTRINP